MKEFYLLSVVICIIFLITTLIKYFRYIKRNYLIVSMKRMIIKYLIVIPVLSLFAFIPIINILYAITYARYKEIIKILQKSDIRSVLIIPKLTI